MANFVTVLFCFLSVNAVFGQFGFFTGNSRDERYGVPQIGHSIRGGIHKLLRPFERPRFFPSNDRPNSNSDSVRFPTSKPIFEDPKNLDKPIKSDDHQDRPVDNQVVFPGQEKEDLKIDDRNERDEVTIETTPATTKATTANTLPPLTAVSTLPPLTPVPSRSNFNFDNGGIFKQTCSTVDIDVGTCVVITECAPLLELVQNIRSGGAPRSAATDMLRRAHCGFVGSTAKVCCPLPGIPTAPAVTTTSSTTTTTTTTTEAAPQPRSEDFSSVFPEPPVCGGGNFTGFRVVGGENAKLGYFPWMTLLGYNRRGSTRWLCGGSLITSKHVLTAAHCIHNHETELYVVRLGELDYSTESDGARPVDVLIKRSIKHERYNFDNFANDVGVLVLQGDVKFTSLISPICMPTDDDLRARSYENYTPIIAGWGNINYQGPASPILQWVQLPVVATAWCARKFAAHSAQEIDARVLCAGAGGGRDACRGDSGGPLMQPIYNQDTLKTYMYQIGIVSYGKGCAFENYPGVYSRVTHFLPWIYEQVAKTMT